MAFLELYERCKSSVSFRKQVYQDASHTPTFWKQILEECLTNVAELQQNIGGAAKNGPNP